MSCPVKTPRRFVSEALKKPFKICELRLRVSTSIRPLGSVTITSSRFPGTMRCSERVCTRFGWGIIICIWKSIVSSFSAFFTRSIRRITQYGIARNARRFRNIPVFFFFFFGERQKFRSAFRATRTRLFCSANIGRRI